MNEQKTVKLSTETRFGAVWCRIVVEVRSPSGEESQARAVNALGAAMGAAASVTVPGLASSMV